MEQREERPSWLGLSRVVTEENEVNLLDSIAKCCYLVPELPHLPLQPMEQRAQWRKLAFRHCRVATEVDKVNLEQRAQSHARMSFAESRQRSTIVKGSAM